MKLIKPYLQQKSISWEKGKSDMIVKLFSRSELVKQVLHPSNVDNYTATFDEIKICSIAEILEIAESSRKCIGKLNVDTFQKGFQSLRKGPIQHGEIIIAILDQDCLADSLFERDEQMNIIRVWEPAFNSKISPAHTIRRLTLRPSDRSWWNGEIYAESEYLYADEG